MKAQKFYNCHGDEETSYFPLTKILKECFECNDSVTVPEDLHLISKNIKVYPEDIDHALHLAKLYGKDDIIEYLNYIKNAYNKFIICINQCKFKDVKTILEFIPDIMIDYDIHGEAINTAAKAGDIEIFKCLHENGGNIRIDSDDPLRLAIKYGNLSIVKYILETIPNFDIKDQDFEFLKTATRNGQMEVLKFLHSKYPKAIEEEMSTWDDCQDILEKLKTTGTAVKSLEEQFIEACEQKQGLEKVIELYQKFNEQ